MPDSTFLDWPFLEPRHRALATEIRAAAPALAALADQDDVDGAARALVRALGEGGWLRWVVPAPDDGGADGLDVRAICLLRESLAYHSGLADFCLAMQGLGTGPIALHGTDEQRRRWLPPVARGEAVAGFAITEREAGSDLAAMASTARSDGDGFVLDGEKAWISNAGIADHYVAFFRRPEAGERSFAAFVVPADAPGLSVSERVEVNAPHVLGTLRFEGCRVPGAALLGDPAGGLRVALSTLDVFRCTVGGAALGFARRALDEALSWSVERRVAGGLLADAQLTRARLADMAVAVDAAALLVYRAAWAHDRGQERVTREAAMAKLHATESAWRVVDDAVQLLGARGVVKDATVERLYQEVRALRIYEGTSEIQKLVVGRWLVDDRRAEDEARPDPPPPTEGGSP